MKINRLIIKTILFFAIYLNFSCNQKNKGLVEQKNVTGPYFGIQAVDTPQIMAPGFISSAASEYNGTFAPDGKQFFYTTVIPGKDFITFTQLTKDNTWTEPKAAPFSGKYPDFDPFFSPDGSKLFFSSKRPVNGKEKSRIWYVEKNNGEWEEPIHIELPEEDQDVFYNSVTRDGTIYFNKWSTGKIYKAQKVENEYIVEELPEIINGGYRKGDPYISPDEDYLIFSGYREDGYGRADLYISFNINGNWTRPENLEKPINSSKQEMCPSVTLDGKIFIFSSNRILNDFNIQSDDRVNIVHKKYQSYDNGKLNIYYMSAGFIENLRKIKNLR